MALGLSIDKLFEVFRNHRYRSRDAVADCLDAVANQADELASIWRTILGEARKVEPPQPDGIIAAIEAARREFYKERPHFFMSNAGPIRAYLSSIMMQRWRSMVA